MSSGKSGYKGRYGHTVVGAGVSEQIHAEVISSMRPRAQMAAVDLGSERLAQSCQNRRVKIEGRDRALALHRPKVAI